MGAEPAVKIAETGAGVKNLLRAAAKPADQPKKSGTPVLTVDLAVKTLATEVRKAKETADSAKTVFEMKSAELVSAITAMREALCRKDYQSAVKVPTLDNLSVMVVWSGNFCKIPGSREGDLVQIVGDRYEDYFKSRFTITAKKDLADEELQDLLDTLGPERFAAYFETEEVIKPTERFAHDMVLMDPDIRQRLELADVKPFKASIRTR